MSTQARLPQSRLPLSTQQHPVPASTPHPIRFDGDWTPAEQRLLEGAIADAERFQEPVVTEPRTVTPWLCYCKRLDGLTRYLAHRAGWPCALHAYGPHALGLQILLFSQEAQHGVGGYSA